LISHEGQGTDQEDGSEARHRGYGTIFMGCIPSDDRKIDRHGDKHQARESCRSASYHKKEIVPLVDAHRTS
jgi:hypothetical protein